MTESPASWTVVPFAKLNGFRAESIDPSQYSAESFHLYSVTAFPSRTPEMLTGASIGSSKQLVRPDDVLICKINPRINRVWSVGAFTGERQIASSEWIGFRSAGQCARFYQHYYAGPVFRSQLRMDLTGVGGSLTRAQPRRVDELLVPVAPIAEQRRIADKLDAVIARVDACRERLNRVAVLLRRFRQEVRSCAVQGQLAGDVSSSDYMRADDVCSTVQSGGTPKGGFPESQGVPFLKVYNIVNQRIDFEYRPQFVGKAVHEGELRKSIALPGDVVMNIVGPPLGKVAVLTDAAPQWNINQAITLFRPSLRITSGWLYLLLCEGSPVRAIMSRTKGSVGQVNVSLSQCRAFEFPVPTVPEQTEIVRRVDLLFAHADRLEARLKQAQMAVDRLTPALLAKAFRGELVPQDPDDEPASVMLERLRSVRAIKAETAPRARGRASAKRSVGATSP